MAFKKKNKTKPNGRGPSFENCQARVTAHMMQSEAFRSLNGSALRVLLMCVLKHDNARYHNKRDEQGRHVWTFTYVDGKQYCDLASAAFSRSMQQLEKIGFIKVAAPGGLKGTNGVKSVYCVSDDWKKWVPEQQNPAHQNILKAHEKNRGQLLKSKEVMTPNLC